MPALVFLDDTGGNIKDIAQPVTALVGLYVDNTKLRACSADMQSIQDDVRTTIFGKVHAWLGANAGMAASYKFEWAKRFMHKYLHGQFELHAMPLYHGAEEFTFLPDGYRYSTFDRILGLVQKYDVPIVGASVQKDLVRLDAAIQPKDKDQYLENLLVEAMVANVQTYASGTGDAVFLAVDEGNSGIRRFLDSTLVKLSPPNVMVEAVRYPSNTHLLIQLADHCAYALSMHYRERLGTSMAAADKKRAQAFFALVSKHINLDEKLGSPAEALAQVALAEIASPF